MSLLHSLPEDIVNNILTFLMAPCDDCKRINLLVDSHACDDCKGCCYKLVCSDHCEYFCSNNHKITSTCPVYFCDPPYDRDDPYTHEVHNDYASHSVSCNVCQEKVYIHRHFTWDSYPYN